eukprot:6473182-Amphidinium_carterae.5
MRLHKALGSSGSSHPPPTLQELVYNVCFQRTSTETSLNDLSTTSGAQHFGYNWSSVPEIHGFTRIKPLMKASRPLNAISGSTKTLSERVMTITYAALTRLDRGTGQPPGNDGILTMA